LDYEVVVVDDGSPDGTADVSVLCNGRDHERCGAMQCSACSSVEDLRPVCQPLSTTNQPTNQPHHHAPQVVRALQPCYGSDRLLLCCRPRKLGLGSAYATGLLAATGDWVLLMDADLSHHPKYIPQLVARQRQTGADVVGGSRYLPGGGVAGWDVGRKLTSRGANVLARTLLGLSASDLTGAFRLYRRSTLAALLSACHCTGYAFQMEMMARAAASGAAIEEVPIVFVDRLYGSSKLGPHEFAQFLAGLVRLMLEL